MSKKQNRLIVKPTYARPRVPVKITAFQDYPGHDGILAKPSVATPPRPPLDANRYNALWQEHLPSTGDRRPAVYSRTSFHGSAIVGKDRRELVGESLLELDLIDILLADRRVVDIEDQRTLTYQDGAGNARKTIVDFIVTMQNGRVIAIAVKPGRWQESTKIREIMAAVVQDNPDKVDDYLVIGEEQITRAATHNARLIRRSRRLRDDADISALAKIVAQLAGAVSIGELLLLHHDDGQGFASAVNLIDDGILVPVSRARITRRLQVRRRSKLSEVVVPVPPLPEQALAITIMSEPTAH